MSLAVRTLTPVWRSGSRSAEQTRLLEEVLELAARVPQGVVSFDLDSTLFDNRPRQLRILGEFAAAKGLSGYQGLTPSDIDAWRVFEAVLALEGAGGREEELRAAWKPFWSRRFFTSEYCRFDSPLPGAAEYVRAVERAGGRVVYLTGRHQGMREGTTGALSEHGFPPGILLTKPALAMSDTAWKEESVSRLEELGEVVACFDNETTHVNAFRRAFPKALVVWIQTDHSLEAEPLPEGIPAIHGFLR